jgi:putative transposase
MDEEIRLSVYRALFRHELDDAAIADVRLALNQGQPLGNGRFLDTIERMTGQRREVRPRGRPKKADASQDVLDGQFGLNL